MKVGIVYDLKTDYGLENDDVNYNDFNHLSEVEAVKKKS